MGKVVIYTAIFGGYDELIDPTYKPQDADFICFTDRDLKSDVWKVIKCTPIYQDMNRCAKKYKILPHRYLSNYDYSIWIDGNIDIISDINEIIEHYLTDNNMALFDHNKNVLDPRNCIYDEYSAIMYFGQRNGNYKDDPTIMTKQMQRYQLEGYPAQNGLATCMIMLRKHTEPDVIKTMEDWWQEIKYGSRRDQLSFNYVAWKDKFKFNYLPGDSRSNKWFIQKPGHSGKR